MENIISKEILSELKLFDNIENRDWKYEVNGNTLKVVYNITNCFEGNWFTINIYELAHKCKEWAFKQGYELRNGRNIEVEQELCYFCEYKHKRQLDYYDGDYFLANTEIESIFKACEWIRKEAK